MTQGERLRVLRKSLDLTLEKFGGALGVGKTAISKLENGENNLTDQMLLLICKEYDVNEDWLRNGDGDMFVQIPEEDLYSKAAASLLKEEDVFAMEALKLYHSLSSDQRTAVKNFIMQLAEKIKEKE